MKRPFGLAALSAFSFAGAVVAGVAAISLAFPHSPLAPIWRLNPRGYQAFASMHGWAIPLLAVVSCACATTGTGLWKRRRWGYLFAVTGLCIHQAGDIFSVVSGAEPLAVIGIPIVAGLLIYLSRPHVRRAFSGS